MDRLLINLFGSPGSGKTVAATSLFAKLKARHLDVVLVSEFAHHKVVEENSVALANQLYIWANQQYNIFCGYRHARVVVTDSPILLGCIYNEGNHSLRTVIEEEHKKYNNFNILMELDGSYPYSMMGRCHSYTESLNIGQRIEDLLTELELPFVRYRDYTEDEIVDLIVNVIE